MGGIKIDICKSRPEIRVMSVSCPLNTTPGKIWEGIFAYVSVFQFKITIFSGIFWRTLSFNLFLSAVYTLIWQNENLVYRSIHINWHLWSDFQKSAFSLMFFPDVLPWWEILHDYCLLSSSYWNLMSFAFVLSLP